jgi:hypothetical protein
MEEGITIICAIRLLPNQIMHCCEGCIYLKSE